MYVGKSKERQQQIHHYKLFDKSFMKWVFRFNIALQSDTYIFSTSFAAVFSGSSFKLSELLKVFEEVCFSLFQQY